ncbi:MAG TPA: MFS transporter [Longimicrobiaceae bacterium]|nr:MFS transporter [Longimicrobiaceae bacterium]
MRDAGKAGGDTALGRGALLALAVVAGVSVAALYYNQPLLDAIARDFGRPAREAGIIATLTQVGYAAGLLLIVPLGDIVERRRLLLACLVAVAASLLAAGLAPSLPLLAAASFAIGFTGVAPQVAVPFAATLTPPEQRGRAVGLVMTGLIVGILLARTVSGVAGSAFGWRAVFLGAAASMLLLAAAVRGFLPSIKPSGRVRYAEVLRGLPPLALQYPVLGQAALTGGLAFAGFSAFWTTLAFFLTTPPWHYGPAAIGMFGLVGVAGALAASGAGRLADRRGPRLGISLGLATVALSFAVFYLFGHSLAGLIAGVLLLDLGLQGVHISNQARVYALPAELHSRLNTIYMVAYFLGGALGSLVGAWAWDHWGWGGVCATGAVMLALGGLTHVLGRSTPPPTTSPARR